MKPTAFGKYLLLERIAVGGMAEVFLAKSFGIEGFERILAIKRILPQLAEDKAFIGMFIDEARIAGQLGHANVTPIYELGKVGSAHYIAMEHVWGKDLLQIMNRFRRLRTRMPAGMVAFIGARMCEALDYAHHKRDAQGNPIGLIHRDVSPQNVLVSYDGAVKLIDFGVAKAKTRTTKTQAGVVKGKFGYMSPEQVKGKKIDHRSDIFALGTCLYEMITLERLFAEDTDFATMEKIRKVKLPPPSELSPGVPPALDEVVMKALTKDPAKRYQTAAEVQEALTRIVMTEEPRLSTTALADFMQKAFAEEMRDEKLRLDSYARVKLRNEVAGEPSSAKKLLLDTTGDGRPPAESIPPSESTAGGAVDETVVGPLPEIELPDEAWPDEPTQIFFSAENPADTATGNIPAPVLPSLAPNEPDTKRTPAPRHDPGPAEAASADRPTPSPPPVAGAARAAPPSPALPTPPTLPTGPADESAHDWSVKEPPTGWLSDGDPIVRPVVPARAKEAPEVRDEALPPLPAEHTPRLPRARSDAAARPDASTVATWKAAVGFVVALALGAGGTYAALAADAKNGRIEVHAYPDAPSRVRIDGVEVGSAPLAPRALRPGTHVVEVEAEGYRPVTRPVIVRPESTVMVHVELAPDAPTGVSQR